MDYIREELLRQRAALARLLLGRAEAGTDGERDGLREGEAAAMAPGGTPAERARTPAARETGRTAETWSRAEAPEAEQGGGSGGGERSRRRMEAMERMAVPTWEAAEGGWAPAGDGGLPETGGRPRFHLHAAAGAARPTGGVPGEGEVPAAGTGFGDAGAGEAAGTGWWETSAVRRRSPLRSESGRAERWYVTETALDAGGEAPGAKALSLAFQRDARRYDGGFELY